MILYYSIIIEVEYPPNDENELCGYLPLWPLPKEASHYWLAVLHNNFGNYGNSVYTKVD